MQCLQLAALDEGSAGAAVAGATGQSRGAEVGGATGESHGADGANSIDGDVRTLLDLLPVAGGDGTLDDRYADLSARGYARAKTGTLTDTSALVGIVTGRSGHTYAYGLLVNDAPILSARAQLDEFVSALREH